MSKPKIADRVEVRRSAHMFEVDGEPFPWYITQEGPQLWQLAPDLYEIVVSILNVAPFEIHADDDRGFAAHGVAVPIVGGRSFPWLLSEDGYTLTCKRAEVAILRLGFFASSLFSHDIPIDNVAAETGDILDLAGNYWQRTENPELPHTFRTPTDYAGYLHECPTGCELCGRPWKDHVI